MAMASALAGDKERQHIAVIGDASIVSGMAFEALNYAGTTDANMLIILNDNAMAIDPTVGAFSHYLAQLKTEHATHSAFFNALGITYKGVVDGHNLTALISALKAEKQARGVRLLHVVTTKGKGYPHKCSFIPLHNSIKSQATLCLKTLLSLLNIKT